MSPELERLLNKDPYVVPVKAKKKKGMNKTGAKNLASEIASRMPLRAAPVDPV